MRENFIRGMALAGWLESGDEDAIDDLTIHEIEGDPGGVTNGVGLTQNTYDAYREAVDEEKQSVESATPDEVLDIYRGNFWDVAFCDDLEDGLDLIVFQYALNRKNGPIKAVKLYQKLLGVRPDGDVGPVTLEALACADTQLIMERFLDYQYHWYDKVRKQDKFTEGLKNRVTRTAKFIDFVYEPPRQEKS